MNFLNDPRTGMKYESSKADIMYTVSQKNTGTIFCDNVGKCEPMLIILSLLNQSINQNVLTWLK